MRFRPVGLLLAAVVAAAVFAGGVRLYWAAQDRNAAEYLVQALRANSEQRRQGLATTRIATPRGWLVSAVRIDYENPADWRIVYLNPIFANATLSRRNGVIWRQARRTSPQRDVHTPGPVMGVAALHADDAAGPASPALSSLDNYQATHMGGGSVAGRPVTIVGLIDKNSRKLIRAFWIDNATHVFLRQDLLNPAGKLVSSTEFTQVDFPTTPLTAVAAPPGVRPAHQPSSPAVRMDISHLSRALGFQVRIPAALPSGFRLKESYLLPCSCGCEGSSAGLHFSDGVRSISVFEVDAQRNDCHVVHSFAGNAGKVIPGPSPALHAAVAAHKGVLFVVIGDLPPDRLRKIASSL